MSDRFWTKLFQHRMALPSVVVLLALVAVTFGISLFFSAADANYIDLARMLQPPSMAHPFGTDEVGRDVFLRAMFGGQVSLRIGLIAVVVSIVIGVSIGAVSGFFGGLVDNVLMRFTDALLAIPTLFLLIVITRIFGQGILVITIILGALSWMEVSRLVRANVLTLKEQDFVTAAHALGVPSLSILVRHVLPNTIAPIVVAATLGVGRVILLEATLSFLGLGLQPPTPSWGTMLNRAQSFLITAPWLALLPGMLILITVLCMNFIGDALRDAMDPRGLRRD
jgi:peptide/nickel transport system permease protein